MKLYNQFIQLTQFTRESIIALLMCGVGVLFMVLAKFDSVIIFIWAEAGSVSILLYWYSFYALIPQILNQRGGFGSYLLKIIQLLAIAFFPFAFIMYVVFERVEMSFFMNLINASVCLVLVAPFTWLTYKDRLSKSHELLGLKTALGRTTADLDFLRSQINPHFLFNALNTLYGTALQENADRTGEGIQMLGDMMRFMLYENTQSKISLNREVEYLNNYIALQKLRTQTSPDIIISTDIEEHLYAHEITPMLLIPFVENAFKHGISLRASSHINITLHVENNSLFFDVSNSIHKKNTKDPERDKNGIGLENVKQRLELLYPGKYQLSIRETAKEFFIHLTLNL